MGGVMDLRASSAVAKQGLRHPAFISLR